MDDTTTRRAPLGRTFLTVWVGQATSLIGSSLTGFGAGLWVFQRTGSATLLSLLFLATTLPGIVLGPVAGGIVDRYDRRVLMLGADVVAALTTVVALALYSTGTLSHWHLMAAVAIASCAGAVQEPAYAAALPHLVPKAQLGRANGLIQTASAIGMLVAAPLAGVILAFGGLGAVLLVDLATFAVAATTVAVVRFPSSATPVRTATPVPLAVAMRDGWRYLRERPGLLGLTFTGTALNFALGFVNVLLIPLLLGFTSEAVAGQVVGVGGAGMLAGGLVLSAWGGPRRRVLGMTTAVAVLGLGTVVAGLRPSVWVVGAGLFVAMFAVPIASGTSAALMQAKIDPDVMGRVFAFRRTMITAAMPLSTIAAGPLADRVMEPLLAPGGGLAASAGAIVGVGAGRGIGLLFVCCGLAIVAAALAGYAYPRVRHLEDELPDAVIAAPVTVAA
jgi:MFS transporter, DHA3 family, macrolide efflux protein